MSTAQTMNARSKGASTLHSAAHTTGRLAAIPRRAASELGHRLHAAEPVIAHGIRPAMHRWQVPRRERFAWRARIHANPASNIVYKFVVGIAGSLFIILAILTGWLPGPGGIPLFLIGMAILASEFCWAHRITVAVVSLVRRIECWALSSKILAICLFGVVIVACGYAYLAILGVPSWIPGWCATVLNYLPGVG